MMVFALLKKDVLIVKKYVLVMLLFAVLIPPFMRWRVPEFTGTLGFILSVIFSVFMLLQYVSIKEYQYPRAAVLLCAAPFSRRAMVLSKYVFCMAAYAMCCMIYGIETLVIPGLGRPDMRLFAVMFCAISAAVGVYLPVQYKFGFDRAKYIFAGLIIFSPMCVPLLMRTVSPRLSLFLAAPRLFYSGIALLGAVFLAVSAFLSVKIYDKADLS